MKWNLMILANTYDTNLVGRSTTKIIWSRVWIHLLLSIEGNMIEQIATNKSSLLLKNILQNTQILQLFTMVIKTESIYKSN